MIVTITTPGVASHSWLNLILQNSKSYVVVDGGTISGSTYTVAGANVVKAWEDNNITDGEWYQICLQGGTAADPACDIIVTVTAAASDSDIVLYNLEKTPDESVIIADGLESNSDTWGSPVLFDHRNVGNLKAYLDRDLYIKVIVDKGSVPQKLGIQHNVNYGYMYEYPITDGPYAVDDEKEAYYVSIKDWMAGYAEQEIPLDNSEPDKGSAENVGNVKVIGACTIYGFQVVIKGSAEPIPEPEPTYKPELDEYTVILGSTDNDKNTTALSASEKTMFAQSYGGNFDNAVKSHLASMTEDQYIKIIVNNGALTSLYFSDWIEIPGDNKNYANIGDIKVPLGDIYIGETDSEGNTAYYIPYSVMQTIKSAYLDNFENICSMYATGTGTVTWIGVVEAPATEPEPGAPECVVDGPVRQTSNNHTFLLPNGKNISVGETVTVIFSYDAEANFRMVLGNGADNNFDRSVYQYLDSGRVIDKVIEFTARDDTDDIKYIHTRPSSYEVPSVDVTYDSIYIFYGTAAQYEAWHAKPENVSFTTKREHRDHPEGEVVLSLEGKEFPYSGNPITFPIKTLSKGDTITVHVTGTADADFRFYLTPGTDNAYSNIVYASGYGFTPGKEFDLTFELTVSDDTKPVTTLQVKGLDSSTPLNNLTITHLAIVYPPLECKDTHEGWKQANIAKMTNNGTDSMAPDTYYVPFAEGDVAYLGDTIEYCIIGKTDSDCTAIRAYPAKDAAGNSNNLTDGTAISGAVENGEFWLKDTTPELKKPDSGNSIEADYFYFKPGYGTKTTLDSLTFNP